jgi:tRNA (cmo5U34)-methyltransferase|tara:strand:- start:2166 stop:2897 length:732 start_codon:yes stop_codon:yes gene_type:complete
MTPMGKQDNIFEEGNLSGLPFTFNQEVTEVFEDMINRSVPGYRTSLRLITLFTKHYYQSDTTCYDIGCSLGASSLSMLQAKKDVKIIAIDNSEAMIEECKNRFQNLPQSQSIQFLQQDVMEVELDNASIIVLNYLIQFLDLEQRERLFDKIFSALLPGGILILSEKIHYKNSFESNRIFRTHHKFKSINGYSDLEISGKRDSLEGVLITEPEEDHFSRGARAGFKSSTKILSNLNFRTFIFCK